MKKLFLIFSFFCAFVSCPIYGQTVVAVEPLFEYPVAPESLESLQDRCNYLVKNFWNGFNFKSKNPVDQYALNDAFQVYTTTFQYASKKEVDDSVDKLLKNISKNNTLLNQFVKAAEVCLYGPRADFWADQIYLRFIDTILKDKKISEKKRARYSQQAASLRKSAEGNSAPSFNFTDKDGEQKQYFPMSTPTILIFGDPDNTDWRLERLKMDSNFSFEEALEKGKVNVLFIVPGEVENWKNNVSTYNKFWTVGQSDELNDKYDLRFPIAIYVIDSSGKIIKRNVAPKQAIDTVNQLVNQ